MYISKNNHIAVIQIFSGGLLNTWQYNLKHAKTEISWSSEKRKTDFHFALVQTHFMALNIVFHDDQVNPNSRKRPRSFISFYSFVPPIYSIFLLNFFPIYLFSFLLRSASMKKSSKKKYIFLARCTKMQFG